MFFGVDYYPEQWVFPYAGTADDPEGAWERDAELMFQAGINVVRIGEFSWGLCEPEEGKFDFSWPKNIRKFCRLTSMAGSSTKARAAPFASTTTFFGTRPSAWSKRWPKPWAITPN
jgi:beta-galactosidase GanA